MVYAGLSLGLGLFSGCIAGIFTVCGGKDTNGYLANSRFFIPDYSFYVHVAESSGDSEHSSKQLDVEN